MTENDKTPYTHFIAIGDNHGWGRGKDQKEAIRNMNKSGREKADEYVVYHATEKTYVNDMGGFNRPVGDPAPLKVLDHRLNPKVARGVKGR